MNFLEGIRRIFLLGSLVIVVAAGALGWEVGGSKSQCRVQDARVQQGQSSQPGGKEGNPWDNDPIIWAAPGTTVPATGNFWDNDVLIRPAPGTRASTIDACLKDPGRNKKRAAYAIFFSAVSAVILFAIWLMIRWVFAGFFPNLRRK